MSVKDADGHKLFLYPKEVLRILEGDMDNSLLQTEVGVTNSCNHRCNYCTLDWVDRVGDFIGREALLNSLEDMAGMGVKAIYFAGEGEPLLHKSFPDFVKRSHELGMGVSMSTNGALLSEDLSKRILPYLNWIRIGLDAATPETYSLIHGARKEDFQKTLNNIIYTAKIKKEGNLNVDIGVQSLLLPENLNEIRDLTRIIKETGVDNIQIKPFAQQPFAKQRQSIVDYTNQDLKDLKKDVEGFGDKSFTVVYREKSMERTTLDKEYSSCLGLSFWTLIDAKGNVVPCNLFYDKPKYSFGNIHQQSFKEIWRGDKRKEVLKKLKGNEGICKDYTCRPDLFNRYMWRLKNPEKNDCFI